MNCLKYFYDLLQQPMERRLFSILNDDQERRHKEVSNIDLSHARQKNHKHFALRFIYTFQDGNKIHLEV